MRNQYLTAHIKYYFNVLADADGWGGGGEILLYYRSDVANTHDKHWVTCTVHLMPPYLAAQTCSRLLAFFLLVLFMCTIFFLFCLFFCSDQQLLAESIELKIPVEDYTISFLIGFVVLVCILECFLICFVSLLLSMFEIPVFV